MNQDEMDADAFRRFERTAHDEIADGYRDFFTGVTEFAVDPLLDAAACTSGMRVLDVATGPGVVAFRAANRGASSVVGVDLAPRMLQLPSPAYPGIQFPLVNPHYLPIPHLS